MRRILVAIAAAALAAVPTAAHAGGPRYGTEDCYVEVDSPPSTIVSGEAPFIHVQPGGGPGPTIHCPLT